MAEWQGYYEPDIPTPIAEQGYLFYRPPKNNPMPWWKALLSRLGLIRPTQQQGGLYRTVTTQEDDATVYAWELVD